MIYELENKLSSREVCEMMEIQHKDLLKKIDSINVDFRESKIALSKYWEESTYKVEGQLREYREFQITKRGCEFLAHKTTGTKGNLFTDRYMDKFAAMENVIKNNHPIGILESLQTELQATKQEIAELKQVVFANQRVKLSKREKQLGISASMAEKIDLVPDETIIEIIKSVLPIGTLKVLEEGIALDRNMMLEKAEEKHIAKSILNKKLLLMEIVIPNKDNHAYKQVRQEGSSNWCYVVKKNKLGE